VSNTVDAVEKYFSTAKYRPCRLLLTDADSKSRHEAREIWGFIWFKPPLAYMVTARNLHKTSEKYLGNPQIRSAIS